MSNRAEAPERVRWPIVGAGVALAAVFTVATLILADPAPPLRNPAANPADSLVGAWTAAAGGRAVFDSLQAVSFTVTRIGYDTLTGRASGVESHDVWIRWRAGVPAVRIDHAAGSTAVMGFDGRSAWALVNRARVPDGSPLQQEAVRATQEVLRWLDVPYTLSDSSVVMTYRGTLRRSDIPLLRDDGRSSVQPEHAEFHSVTVERSAPVGVPSEFTYYFNLGDRFPSDVTYTDRGRVVREVMGSVERAGSTSLAYVARRDLFVGSGSRLETVLIADFDVDPHVSGLAFDAPGDDGS
jgi:hypothetical protein